MSEPQTIPELNFKLSGLEQQIGYLKWVIGGIALVMVTGFFFLFDKLDAVEKDTTIVVERTKALPGLSDKLEDINKRFDALDDAVAKVASVEEGSSPRGNSRSRSLAPQTQVQTASAPSRVVVYRKTNQRWVATRSQQQLSFFRDLSRYSRDSGTDRTVDLVRLADRRVIVLDGSVSRDERAILRLRRPTVGTSNSNSGRAQRSLRRPPRVRYGYVSGLRFREFDQTIKNITPRSRGVPSRRPR